MKVEITHGNQRVTLDFADDRVAIAVGPADARVSHVRNAEKPSATVGSVGGGGGGGYAPGGATIAVGGGGGYMPTDLRTGRLDA